MLLLHSMCCVVCTEGCYREASVTKESLLKLYFLETERSENKCSKAYMFSIKINLLWRLEVHVSTSKAILAVVFFFLQFASLTISVLKERFSALNQS